MNWGFISCALINIVNIVCFTILAITFNKWWIILFACLFQAFYKHDDGEDNPKEGKNIKIFELNGEL